MKAFLSGMPTCRLGLNMHGQDCTFSSVVSQAEWETAKCISFVPPDNGNKTEFEVMRYRLSDQIRPPFRLVPNIIETGRTRVSVRFFQCTTYHALAHSSIELVQSHDVVFSSFATAASKTACECGCRWTSPCAHSLSAACPPTAS
jgi:Adaptor complexes medium subunit family